MAMKYAGEISSVINMIEAAFANVPKPRITRSVANGFDDEWTLTLERGKELWERDSEQHWHDVTDDQIISSQNYFSFADDEGWRFYLPAHMCFILRDFVHNDGYDAVYNACTGKHPHFGSLNPQQKMAVEAFVDLVQILRLENGRFDL